MAEYIRVTPTTEQLEPQDIPRRLNSLHNLTASGSTGPWERINPLSSSEPPRFEFLAISDGADEPVEFLYRTPDHLDTLAKRLRSIYPSTFDIERVDEDITTRLLQPARYSRSEFIDRYEAGDLLYDFTEEEIYQFEEEETTSESPPEHAVVVDDIALELAPPTALSAENPVSALDKPTLTADGEILARPTPAAVSPRGVRWDGDPDRDEDWMTTVTPFTASTDTTALPSVDQPGDTLATLIDYLTEISAPVAFQAVFQQKDSYQTDADARVKELKKGTDNFIAMVIRDFFEQPILDEERELDELSGSRRTRIEAIERKNSKRSFTVNLRMVGVPTSDDHSTIDSQMDSIQSVFDPLDGPFYGLSGRRLRDAGIREKTQERNARQSLARLLDSEMNSSRLGSPCEAILSGAELANLILVPSSEQLSVSGTRGTRAEFQSRNPLHRPNPDVLAQYREGMAIGYPLDESGNKLSKPIQLPPEILTTHFARLASTGGGKSMSAITDSLSLHANTAGPTVLTDRKGDGMIQNYLRCHFERFGDLDDVYEFRLPERNPAISFFDIRPALAAGRAREDAVQDKVDHCREILSMVMDEERFKRAFVGNEILNYLIKALFDHEYGSDVFGLDDLLDAVERMHTEQTIPPVAADNQHIEDSLTRHFARDHDQFDQSMNAVGNRLGQLKNSPSLRKIFNHAPGQGDDDGETPTVFDFRDLLDEDVVLLFDLGELRPEAQRAITLLLLSNLWDAVQMRRREEQSEQTAITNLIIDEAAPIVATDLVSEQLLPQGRSFGLSLGLLLQFPQQVVTESERAYDEMLNNVGTKMIGNITIEENLAKSLAHEELSPTDLRNRFNTLPPDEWIVDSPGKSFTDPGPPPFSMKPLPIPPGHPESDRPLSAEHEGFFESVALPDMRDRTRQEFGLPTDGDDATGDREGWGSARTDSQSASEAASADQNPDQSAFFSDDLQSNQATDIPEESEHDESSSTAPDTAHDHSGTRSTDPGDASQTTDLDKETSAQSKDAARDSIPLKSAGVDVSDVQLRTYNLSHDDARFLNEILDIMNRDSAEYTLLDRMTSIRDEFENLAIERLTTHQFLDTGSAAGQTYYTVLTAGQQLLGKPLKTGPGQGDLGEKTPHKVGVKLLELWLHEQDDVVRVEPYYRHGEDVIFDVAGFDSSDDLIWVGEAELSSHNKDAPVADYDKLRDVDADAVWAFNRRETAVEVLESLAAADRIEASVSGRAARSFGDIQDAVEEFDADGMTTVLSFTHLFERFDT